MAIGYSYDCVTLRKLLTQASSLAQQSAQVQQHRLKLRSLHLALEQVHWQLLSRTPGSKEF